MSKLTNWIDQFGFSKGGVIHVGAHEAQEASDYAIRGLEPVLWFEAVPSLVDRASERLKVFPNQRIHSGLLWSEPGQMKTLNLSSNDLGSSSIFQFHLHSASYPQVRMENSITLQTTTLDSIVQNYSEFANRFSYLVLDVQGSELEVLKGSKSVICNLDAIMVEVSIRELYKDAPVYSEIIDWLSGQGFTLIADDINQNVGWGDALFLRTAVLKSRYPHIQPAKATVSGKMPSLGVLSRSILVKVGMKPEYLTRSFLKGIFRR